MKTSCPPTSLVPGCRTCWSLGPRRQAPPPFMPSSISIPPSPPACQARTPLKKSSSSTVGTTARVWTGTRVASPRQRRSINLFLFYPSSLSIYQSICQSFFINLTIFLSIHLFNISYRRISIYLFIIIYLYVYLLPNLSRERMTRSCYLRSLPPTLTRHLFHLGRISCCLTPK